MCAVWQGTATWRISEWQAFRRSEFKCWQFVQKLATAPSSSLSYKEPESRRAKPTCWGSQWLSQRCASLRVCTAHLTLACSRPCACVRVCPLYPPPLAFVTFPGPTVILASALGVTLPKATDAPLLPLCEVGALRFAQRCMLSWEAALKLLRS